MKTRSLRKLLTAVLMSSLPLAATGCSDTAASVDGSLADAGNDDVPMSTDAGVDVSIDRGTDAPADVAVDVAPDRFCGMCGCDFTGRVEGRGTVLAEHCLVGSEDAGAPTDASAPDPTTCEIDCTRACQNVSIPGLFRPWTSGQGSCERASATEVTCVLYVPCGRRTDGQRDLPTGRGSADYLVRAAFLEAQSVGAFERMALELRAHDAPAGLVRGAERSAREERAHAASMAVLCEARGATTAPVEAAPTSVRDLRALALENAVEGCARETWGALLALHQSARAADQDVRDAMTTIARDEVRHAALSWALHRWALPRLDAAARAEVTAALEHAWSELETAVSVPPPAELVGPLGLPEAMTARRLAHTLREQLAG